MQSFFVAEIIPFPGNIYQRIERLSFELESQAQEQAAKWRALGHSSQVWKETKGYNRVLLHVYPIH